MAKSETTDDEEWNPEPAELREGEVPDSNAHAQGNLEQIRRAVADGDLEEGYLEEMRQRLDIEE